MSPLPERVPPARPGAAHDSEATIVPMSESLEERSAPSGQPGAPPGRRRKPMISVLPTLLTLGNAVCGFASITYVAGLGPERATADEMYFAALLVFGAIIFDGLDGPAARLTKATSDFGTALDSLADAISFGVAPAFLMLRYASTPYAQSTHTFQLRVLWMTALLYVLCAVLRLARFGVQSKEVEWRSSFCGLPSPTAAATVASLVIIGRGVSFWAKDDSPASMHLDELLHKSTTAFIPLVTLIVTMLMVSRFRYPRVTKTVFARSQRYSTMVKLIFAGVLIFLVHELAVPLLFFGYVFYPPLAALLGLMRRKPTEPASEKPIAG
jgi:CDP-diacylglycerol--serine O-phosphatidyltransferase